MKEFTLPNTWTNKTYQEFVQNLRKLQDKKYLEFNKKTIYTNYEMIGIRVPILRNIAKKIKKTSMETYLEVANPNTFEEIFIYGLIISYIKDYNNFLKHFTLYLKYIDNWAISDMVVSSFKIISKNKESFEEQIKMLLKSKNEYEVRVAIVSLMYYYIEKEKLKDIFKYLNDITHEGYYVHMAIAWTISEIYINYKQETIAYLKNNNLKKITQNKAIQKIRESNRVSQEEKENVLKYKAK